MTTLVVFLVSLALIIILILIRGWGISRDRNLFLDRIFSKPDQKILKIFSQVKIWLLQINLKNTKLIFSKIMVSMRRVAVLIKRRFDHKQSYFFTKREHDSFRSKRPASFFLKNISEHKKYLRENRGE